MAKTIRRQPADRDHDDPQFYHPTERSRAPRVSTGPSVGQPCTVRGVPCRIAVIRAMNTLDVVATDGSGRAWRVSGLAGFDANTWGGQ